MPLASVATVCHDWTEEDGELTCLDEDELFYTGHYGFAEMGGELFAIVEY